MIGRRALAVTAHWMQGFLLVAGFLILGYCGADWFHSRLRQAEGNRELDRILAYKPGGNPAIAVPEILVSTQVSTQAPAQVPRDGLIGRVEIPRLHLSAVVFQGTDTSVLDHGVGHLDGSALPGQAGNVVLAAHRDTFFRKLHAIRKDDVITVTTETGPRTYEVDLIEVVDPALTSVLDPTVKPTLTLITCYPFEYIGNAPRRFIVRARDTQAE